MAVASAPAAEQDGASTPVLARALPIAGLALALGILAQLLFFDVGLGINFPIAILALLLAAWFAAAPERHGLSLREAWLPAGALLFASFVALRGDWTLVALDVIGSLALTAGSVAALGGLRPATRPLGGLLVLGLRMAGAAIGGAATVVGAALQHLPPRSVRHGLGRWAGVLRGVAIALPLALVFVALFSAADAVFASWTDRLLDWDLDLGGMVGRTLVALVAGWLAAGILGFVARPGEDMAERGLIRAWDGRPRIGSIEVVTVLVILNAVFAAFVVLQAAYLFGGLDTLAETSLTYAEYARRGFFELLAVAFLVGALVLGTESFVRERTLAYRVALIGLVAMTLVVLASAFLRLRLYQDAYGWTELRFYVLAAIFWLAIGTVMAVATILANRSGWLLHGMLALSLVFGLAFNVIGPIRFVAEQNVARAYQQIGPRSYSWELDWPYLAGLGSDAVPVIPTGMRDISLPPAVIDRMLDEMASASGLDDPRNDAWQAWNLSREHARALLR